MSIEDALVARAAPYMISARTAALVRREAGKGCSPEIAPEPVSLEPRYETLRTIEEALAAGGHAGDWTYEAPAAEHDLIRVRLWVSPEQDCNWNRSELFLKQLTRVGGRVALEIAGNRQAVTMTLLCRRADLPVVQAAFAGQFEASALSFRGADWFSSLPAAAWRDTLFFDLWPPPPYSHLMTRPDELQRSPYAVLFGTLSALPPPGLGFYQVVFEPVAPDHNWHANVEALRDLEFSLKLMGGISPRHRYAQQAPSGDLKQMAFELETKSHSDKPFFAAAVRLGVVGAERRAAGWLQSLACVGSLIQHGGRPLNVLTAEAYRQRLSADQVHEMFCLGLAYRPGFLVNSWELTSLVHVPPTHILASHESSVSLLETLPPSPLLSTGTPLGVCSHAGEARPVCLPERLRNQHVHIIGGIGKGKSSLLEHIICDEGCEGHGGAVIDPHGRLVQRLLDLLPEECADRVIYMDPGDPEWVPIWNPLSCRESGMAGRLADDLVRSFKSVVEGWGDRLEHLLRHAIFALLHVPGASLLDVANLLRQKSDESGRLRSLVLQNVDNELSKTFWNEDFMRYRGADLTPAQHKLSKLLTSGSVSLMLSQGQSAFDLRAIMDDGKILLIDLSNVGPEVREILGCFMLSLMHLTALGRGSGDEDRRPFHIYVDEAHRFMTDALEDLIAETRKFDVSLTLAHQYMSQFESRKIGALSSVGTTIIFRIDTRDAGYLRKDLQDLVEVEDLITLDVGEAIARIGNEVVHLRTPPPREVREDGSRERILAASHERYYRRKEDVARDIRRRWALRGGPRARADVSAAALRDERGNRAEPETFEYEEF